MSHNGQIGPSRAHLKAVLAIAREANGQLLTSLSAQAQREIIEKYYKASRAANLEVERAVEAFLASQNQSTERSC